MMIDKSMLQATLKRRAIAKSISEIIGFDILPETMRYIYSQGLDHKLGYLAYNVKREDKIPYTAFATKVYGHCRRKNAWVISELRRTNAEVARELNNMLGGY